MGKENEFRGDRMDILTTESSANDQSGSILEYQFRYFESNGKFPDLVKSKVRETHHYKQKHPLPADSISEWLDELFAVIIIRK